MNCDMTRRSALTGLASVSLLSAACQPSSKKLDADVIIMGAGLSGLYAAMLLEDEGLDVLVIEAAPRVGGRMFTLEHEGGFTEGGGQQIGANYARVLDVAESLGVPLYSQTGRGPDTAHFLNEAWQSGGITVPQFPEPFQSTSPSSVLFRLLSREPGLESSESWLNAGPEFDISAKQFLSERGFSLDAQGLINRALNANSLETYSMLNLHRSWQLYRQSGGMGASQYVEGGSQRLPEAMAASLARPVLTNSPVSKMDVTSTYCDLTVGQRTYRSKQVICTLPFPALRRIKGIADIATPELKDALTELPYTQIVQFHMRNKNSYWDVDSLAPNMWTDTELERIFADTGRDGQPNGFCRGWINGTGVSHWSDLDPETAQTRYIDRLAEVRPSTESSMAPLAYIDWTNSNPYAGGAYFHWKPGQATKLAQKMGDSIGKLHFAGEHLGILHTGMEAAMESAERTALAIIEEVV